MPDFTTVCEEAARAAGVTLLDWRGRFKAREKARADLVTEADVAAQKAIEQVILGAFPTMDSWAKKKANRSILARLFNGLSIRWTELPTMSMTFHTMPLRSHFLAMESYSLELSTIR